MIVFFKNHPSFGEVLKRNPSRSDLVSEVTAQTTLANHFCLSELWPKKSLKLSCSSCKSVRNLFLELWFLPKHLPSCLLPGTHSSAVQNSMCVLYEQCWHLQYVATCVRYVDCSEHVTFMRSASREKPHNISCCVAALWKYMSGINFLLRRPFHGGSISI